MHMHALHAKTGPDSSESSYPLSLKLIKITGLIFIPFMYF